MAHKHMKLVNSSKRRKKFKFKLFFYLVVIYVSFCYTFYYSLKNIKSISNKEFVNFLIKTGNVNVLSKYKLPNLVNSTMKLIFNIDFTNPSTIFNVSILRYGVVNRDTDKVIRLEYTDDYSDMDELKKISDYVENPNPKLDNEPIVYIYNSHQLENYSSNNLDVYGITPNVMMASYVFREKLNDLGVSSIVEDANMSDILSSNGWNYAYSYQASRMVMEDKKKKYNSLKYFVDIHRDSVPKSSTTVVINDVSYAKVLFVVGLDYSGWENNYEVASKINSLIEHDYLGLSRGIMKKSGPNVNGVYNQDFSNNCVLIEIGGVENTIEEVYQTMEVLAVIFDKYIKGDSR